MQDIRELIRESNHIEEVWDEAEDERSYETWLGLTATFKFISTSAVLMTHESIMEKLYPSIAGMWRTWNVEVGGYVAPHYTHVPALMNIWVVDQEHMTPQQAHVAFERIHPFADGNGRTGRMLMWFQEWLNGSELTEIAYEDRASYYSWFIRR